MCIKSAVKSGIKIQHLLLPSPFPCSPGAKYFPYQWHKVGGTYSALFRAAVLIIVTGLPQRICRKYNCSTSYVVIVWPVSLHLPTITTGYIISIESDFCYLFLLLGMSEMMAKYITSVELPNSIQKYHSFLLVHSTLRLDSSLLSLAG